jgi:hypothetical protein
MEVPATTAATIVVTSFFIFVLEIYGGMSPERRLARMVASVPLSMSSELRHNRPVRATGERRWIDHRGARTGKPPLAWAPNRNHGGPYAAHNFA